MRILSRLNPKVRKVVDWIVGVLLIALGIVGLFLPVLQGWLFIFAGLAVLSRHNRHAHALNERLKRLVRSLRDRVLRKREPQPPESETR